MKTERKTTKKDIEIFSKECEKWQQYFGLQDWRFDYFISDLGDDRAAAQATYYLEDRVAKLKLNKTVHKDDGPQDIKEYAFHEVCEVFLGKLSTFANNSQAKYLVSEEVHVIIRTLENRVFHGRKD